MLMQHNIKGCAGLLKKQLEYCERTLTGHHPLAAKMLAVMARLHLKQGGAAHEEECEKLQQRVLAMRRAALGLHHEDTHRSAMDVYSRRRAQVVNHAHDQDRYAAMGGAMEVCFEMLQVACGRVPGYLRTKGSVLMCRPRSLCRWPRWRRAARTASRSPSRCRACASSCSTI